MNAAQTEFTFRGKSPAERERMIENRRSELVCILGARSGRWVTSNELRAHGFSKRELRLIAENDKAVEILSFPGSPGYKLFADATVAEIRRTLSLRSEARKLLRRFVRYQRKIHAAGI